MEVEKLEGYIPENNANAIINLDHLKNSATYIPHNCTCYVSPLKELCKLPQHYLNLQILKNYLLTIN